MSELPVPFIPNTDDDTHCFQACLQMVLTYIDPGQSFTMERLKQITNKPPGKWTWIPAALHWLHTHGYHAEMITAFDYAMFAEQGIDYLRSVYDESVAKQQQEKSDLPLAQQDASCMLSVMQPTQRVPTLDDIQHFLHHDIPVIATVDLAVLNDLPQYVGHMVVVIGMDTNTLTVHDPGLPPQSSRTISRDTFTRAWGPADGVARHLIRVQGSYPPSANAKGVARDFHQYDKREWGVGFKVIY